MYARPCHTQLFRWNLRKCLANLSPSQTQIAPLCSPTRTYVTKVQDAFKILQVSERRKKQRDYLPGIENRKELLQEWDDSPYQNENEIIPLNVDPEEFNAMKADFMDVDKSYVSHKSEEYMKRLAKVRSQVKKKHFREAKQPKLLTITEMYQIKLLHKQNPVEWTIEKLSESFPATPDVILKVIDNNSPRSAERMLEHDTDVKHNWFLLQTGKLAGLSPYYEQHLAAFSAREPVVRTIAEYKKFIPPPFRYVPERTEFRSIITSYYESVNKKKSTGEPTAEISNTEEQQKLLGQSDKTSEGKERYDPNSYQYENPQDTSNYENAFDRDANDRNNYANRPFDRHGSYGNRNNSYGNRNRSYGNQNNAYGNRNRSYGNQNNAYGSRNRLYGRSSYNGYSNSYQSNRENNFRNPNKFNHQNRGVFQERTGSKTKLGSVRWFSSSTRETGLDKEAKEKKVEEFEPVLELEERVGNLRLDEKVDNSASLNSSSNVTENKVSENQSILIMNENLKGNDFNKEQNILSNNDNQKDDDFPENRNTEIMNKQSSESSCSGSGVDETSRSPIDVNRTMHSQRPAYWRSFEREIRKEERQRVKAEPDLEGAVHDGRWRRIKPNIGHATFTPLEQELRHQYNQNDDYGYREDQYETRLDRNRMDLERIGRNRISRTSLLFDPDEELLPEEKYEHLLKPSDTGDSSSHQSDHYSHRNVSTDSYPSNRESCEDNYSNNMEQKMMNARIQREVKDIRTEEESNFGAEETGDRVSRAQRTEERHAGEEDASTEEFADRESQGPLSQGIVLNPNPSASSSSNINKRMYPSRPPHWQEVTRQRNREEREKEAVRRMIEEDMEDKAMYDGRWRRLRPRTRSSNPFADEDNRPHIAQLNTRRMETMQNITHEEEETIQEPPLAPVRHWLPNIHEKLQNSSLQAPRESSRTAVVEHDPQMRPKFDYYLEEGIDTKRYAKHYTLDKLGKVLDDKQRWGGLEQDEEVLVRSYEKKKRLREFDSSNSGTEDTSVFTSEIADVDSSNSGTKNTASEIADADNSNSGTGNSAIEIAEADDSNDGTEDLIHSSAGTHMTTYNTRSSQADHLFTGTLNHTGIVSQGVDITERDVQIELANHVELKIQIPRELYKEDAVYKVEDCFYDDEGHFLYRVPGLKNA